MKNSVQRFLSVFLALMMVVSMFPTAAFATEEHDHVHEEETLIEGTDTSVEEDVTDTPTEEEGTEPPAEGDGTEPPAEGDGTDTPVEGDGTEPPAADEGTDTPVEGDGTEPPAEGDGSDTPAEGEGTVTPENPDENTGTPENPEQGSEGAVVAPEGSVEGSGETTVPAPETPVVTPEVVVPTLLDEVKATVDELLVTYGLEVGMSEEEIEAVVLDLDEQLDPEADMEALEELTYGLTEEELEELQAYEAMQTWDLFCQTYAAVASQPAAPSLLDQVKTAVDELLVTYGLEVGMSEDDLLAVVLDLDWHLDPEADMEALEELAYDLTEEELEELEEYEPLQTWVEFYLTYGEVYEVGLYAASGTHYPVEGVEVSVSGATDNSMSNGAVTVTAKGSNPVTFMGAVIIEGSARITTITVSNSSENTATVSFDWTATSVNQLVIDGTTYSGASNSFSKVMAAGESFTITITTAKNNTTNKLVMNNFAFEKAKDSSAVTFVYDSTLGSVTVDGAAVTGGAVLNIDGTAGAALVATPVGGATFVGWIDENNKRFATEATHQLIPAADMTVRAVFASANTAAWFDVDGTYLVNDLGVATDLGEKITLAADGTLPSGTHTVPVGKTLLIPFDNANTLYNVTDKPASTKETLPRQLYRKLTMAEGAELIINGEMSLSAKSNSSQGNHGSVNGAYSQVDMKSGSSITVNNGGTLYAWGYISGNGEVLAKSGSTVYEFFQVTDWRGGSFMTGSGVLKNDNKVFPFLQYYVQNIEVPLTLEAGATEKGYVSIQVSYMPDQSSEIPFIGDNSMFIINSGSVTKDYDEQNDRLVLTLNGDISMSSVELSMTVAAAFGDITVNSADYVLPINHNLSVTVESGNKIEITQDIAMLPGAEITIEDGATCEVAPGMNMFVYDADNWGAYCGSDNMVIKPVVYTSAGRNSKRTATNVLANAKLTDAKVVVNGTVDASGAYLYTTAGGAEITSDGSGIVKTLIGTKTATHQIEQSGTDLKGYAEIPVTPAKLKNADDTIVYTENAENVVTLTYTDGKWVCEEHTKPVDANGNEIPATCKDAQLCTVCGTETAAKLPHTEVVDAAVAATCTETGLTEGKHCSACNEVLVAQTEVAALGHSYGEGVVTTNPTCTAEGVKTFTCGTCGGTKTEAVEKIAHGYQAVVTAPTCTEDGYTTYTCSACGDSYVADYVDALDHTPGEAVVENRTESTCTVAGSYDEVVYCSVCNAELSRETKALELAAHTEGEAVEENRVESTCTVAGSYDEVVYCSVCDEELSRETKALELAAHTEGEAVEENRVESTCTVAGSYDEVVYCSVCDEEISRETVTVDARGHSYGDGNVTTKPTCTEDGVKTFTCSACGDTKTEVVEALGHADENDDKYCDTCTRALCGIDGVNHEWADATCTMPKTCKICGDPDGEALGHTSGTPVEENRVESTCTVAGSYEEVIYCSVCNAELSRETKALELAAHTPGTAVEENRVESTCTVAGSYDEVVYCSACRTHEISRTEKALELAEHTAGTPVEENRVESTCTVAGSYDEVVYCSACRTHEISRTEKALELAAHTPGDAVEENRVESTCTVAGSYDNVVYCTVCDAELSRETITVPALGHDYDEGVVTTKPTCTEQGVMTYTCTVCGHSYTEDILASHTDADENGVCDVCGAVLEGHQHQLTKTDAKAATCTEPGNSAYYTCAACGGFFSDTEGKSSIEKDSWIIPAGHKMTVTSEQSPTCGTTGIQAYYTCTVCEKLFSDRAGTVEITDLESWKTTEGLIPATGRHMLIEYEGKAPLYTEDGYLSFESCYHCGYTTRVDIPALGEPVITTYEEFITNLAFLEALTNVYLQEHPAEDPLELMIKYIRTGVDRYNSGSWNIMAGYEDADFANFIRVSENQINSNFFAQDGTTDNYLKVTGLKNLEEFDLPNGHRSDMGHIFGTMDISYTNISSRNHADVSGWAGDLVDLMSSADRVFSGTSEEAYFYLTPADTLEGMIAQIKDKIFLSAPCKNDNFSRTDFDGDLDGLYLIDALKEMDYTFDIETMTGGMTGLFAGYFTADLTQEDRAEYFLHNRLGTSGTRNQIRTEVYNAYTANSVIGTLEGTRAFLTEPSKLDMLRRACCYAFADYVCQLAGDYVDDIENEYFTDFDVQTSELAPDIVQEIHYATAADGNRMVYYLAVGDLNKEYVHVQANYRNANPEDGWGMSRVIDQANAAQNRYGNPDSPDYIPNYQVVASTNGAGFDMSTGEPGGLLIMNGVEYHPIDSSGFFGITKDGKPVIGTRADYEKYKGQLQEAIAAFGTLIRDGKVVATAGGGRAPRTAVGITRTGKVVMMVLDGRGAPHSIGGDMAEIAQIMLEAGCVEAINLDGGGSTTFVSKPEGGTDLQIINQPSDGGEGRSVSTSLIMVSTAPSSTAFDHAVLESEYKYSTIGTSVQITPKGVSATGNEAQLPEGTTWKLSDDSIGTIDENGVFTGTAYGEVEIFLMQGDTVLGRKTHEVVVPAQVYFTRSPLSAVQGDPIRLPVAARYNGKAVAISLADIRLTLSNSKAGTISGFTFTAAETDLKTVEITVTLAQDANVSGKLVVNIFKPGENNFDFESATGGDRQLAWLREISNSETVDKQTYTAVDPEKDMVTTYTFAMDMTSIPIPAKLADLVYMLPGSDKPDASAWTFLLQLAERVSPMTEVTPVLRFDTDLKVDYSQLQVLNEYFALNGVEFDEETNTLTMHLNWVDQTQAIDPSTANPLCLVSGIKLTPKEGTGKRVDVVNGGEISYKIYMRASSLYSFCQKEENQKLYGLYPYINPADSVDAGGMFTDTYKTFEDSYTLSYVQKEGWINEGNGWAYYVNGERLTGMQVIDGYYYDMGSEGLNQGQTKFTGLYHDGTGNMHISQGLQVTTSEIGWTPELNGKYYHYHSDGYVYEGTFKRNTTCIKGAWPTYTCHTCNTVTRAASYAFPDGHTWDANHKCTICGTVGIDITKALKGFGKLDSPTTNPRYYFQKGGVRPSFFVSMDGKTTLTYSNDNNVNSDHTMRDLYVSWINDDGIGKAVMNITGRGNYYGETYLEYTIVPNDVTDLTVVSTTTDSITLKWTKPAGSDYVRLYEYFAETGTRKTINAKITGNSYTVTGLTPGKHEFWAATSAVSDNPAENGQVYNCPQWGKITAYTVASAVESAVPTGNQVKITFNSQPVADGSWQVIVAGYDLNGKMIASNVAAVTGRTMDVELKNAASAHHITVFVIDSKYKPLMESKTTP